MCNRCVDKYRKWMFCRKRLLTCCCLIEIAVRQNIYCSVGVCDIDDKSNDFISAGCGIASTDNI